MNEGKRENERENRKKERMQEYYWVGIIRKAERWTDKRRSVNHARAPNPV